MISPETNKEIMRRDLIKRWEWSLRESLSSDDPCFPLTWMSIVMIVLIACCGTFMDIVSASLGFVLFCWLLDGVDGIANKIQARRESNKQ